MPRLICFASDYGHADDFAGVCRGVIARLAPQVRVIDVTHGLPQRDVMAGALILRNSLPYMPEHAVHLTVVDPGVGGTRRAVALRSHGDRLFVGPDNGLMMLAVARDGGVAEAVELTNDELWLSPLSATFHGRDIFAPVAAHLALGVPVTLLGPVIRDYVNLAFPVPSADAHGLSGEIVHIDRFGNCISNIAADQVAAGARVQFAGRALEGVRQTYADVTPGEIMALIGSAGYLEIAVRDGDAARLLSAQVGDPVRVA